MTDRKEFERIIIKDVIDKQSFIHNKSLCFLQFSLFWKLNDNTKNCACLTWNSTYVDLFSYEREHGGHCEPVCSSQMCGIQHHHTQSLIVYVNSHYNLLMRHCDDLLLQPSLPTTHPPFLVQPTTMEKPLRVGCLF